MVYTFDRAKKDKEAQWVTMSFLGRLGMCLFSKTCLEKCYAALESPTSDTRPCLKITCKAFCNTCVFIFNLGLCVYFWMLSPLSHGHNNYFKAGIFGGV